MQCCSRLLIEAHRGIELQATGVDHLSLLVSLYYLASLSPSSTTAYPLRPILLSLFPSLFLHGLSLSAYLVLNYPNSISVQLQFIPVSKRQSRRVHFASTLPPGAIISFLFISPPLASSIRSHFVPRLLLAVYRLTSVTIDFRVLSRNILSLLQCY